MPADDLTAERRRKLDELARLGVAAYNVDFFAHRELSTVPAASSRRSKRKRPRPPTARMPARGRRCASPGG